MNLRYESIVISGIPASGKSLLIKGLLGKLDNWAFHSIGDLVKARHRKVYPNIKTEIPLSEWWANLSETEQVKFNEDLFKLVRNGKIIADTRYAILCREGDLLYKKTGNERYKGVKLNSLLVFMEAPLDIRTRRVIGRGDYRGKTQEEIRSELKRRELNEIKLGKEIFGINYQDKSIYDLVLNSENMTPREEVQKVMEFMQGFTSTS